MQQLAARTALQEGHFEFKTTGTHVHVKATDKKLGMRELAAVMRKDPNLHNCVVEQCRFDADGFSALLRIE